MPAIPSLRKIMLNMPTKATFKERNATYQTILYGNAQMLAHFVIGKSKAISFDVPATAIKRNDNLEIQQHILSMTPTERKILGISKSGLWYQKKKIAEGKPVKIYGKFSVKYSTRNQTFLRTF